MEKIGLKKPSTKRSEKKILWHDPPLIIFCTSTFCCHFGNMDHKIVVENVIHLSFNWHTCIWSILIIILDFIRISWKSSWWFWTTGSNVDISKLIVLINNLITLKKTNKKMKKLMYNFKGTYVSPTIEKFRFGWGLHEQLPWWEAAWNRCLDLFLGKALTKTMKSGKVENFIFMKRYYYINWNILNIYLIIIFKFLLLFIHWEGSNRMHLAHHRNALEQENDHCANLSKFSISNPPVLAYTVHKTLVKLIADGSFIRSVPGDLSSKLNPSRLILWVFRVQLSHKKWFRP